MPQRHGQCWVVRFARLADVILPGKQVWKKNIHEKMINAACRNDQKHFFSSKVSKISMLTALKVLLQRQGPADRAIIRVQRRHLHVYVHGSIARTQRRALITTRHRGGVRIEP